MSAPAELVIDREDRLLAKSAFAKDPPHSRRAYVPENLHPEDAQARQFDDTTEGIDWDEIIATTQDDFLAGRFAFNSADYPDHATAMAEMKCLMGSILEKVLRETTADRSLDAARR